MRCRATLSTGLATNEAENYHFLVLFNNTQYMAYICTGGLDVGRVECQGRVSEETVGGEERQDDIKRYGFMIIKNTIEK